MKKINIDNELEYIEKVNELKDSLSNTKEVLDIKELNEEIKKDKKLLELLNEYHLYPKEETKKQILDNELFRKYKEKETDLNILILKINSELKQITKKDKCGL